MKYVSIAVVLAFIVAAAAIPVALAGSSDPTPGFDPPPAGHTVTFCHVAGLEEDPANTITITTDEHAAYGPAGHFNENGTPAAGHEEDHLGVCAEDEDPPQLELVGASVQPVQSTCEGDEAALIFGNEDKVNYSVEGNVAPGETVSVTAKAKEGYEITGLSEFEIEFDSFDSAACQGDGGEGVAGEKGLASVAPVVTSKAPSGGDLPFTL